MAPNGLSLGLELLAHAEVPLRTRAVALRRMADQSVQNIEQIRRTPTGASGEIEAACRALYQEVEMMRRTAVDLERMAAVEELEAAPVTPEPAPPGAP